MPNFEEFDRQLASSQSTRPTISVRSSGVIGINKAAYEAFGEPRAVKLLYGADERAIGFRPSHESARKAYTIKESKPNGGGYTVAGAAYLKHYKIAYDQTRRYAAEMVDGDLAIYLDRNDKRPTHDGV